MPLHLKRSYSREVDQLISKDSEILCLGSERHAVQKCDFEADLTADAWFYEQIFPVSPF